MGEIGMVNAEVLVNEINMLPPEARALLYELLPYAVKQCAENPGKPFYETNCDLDRFLEVVGKCRADFSNDAEIMELAYSSMSNISIRIDAFLFWTERELFERCRVFNNRIHYVFSKQFAASLAKHEKELMENRVYVCRGCGKNINRMENNPMLFGNGEKSL